jgi:hypothetical protein
VLVKRNILFLSKKKQFASLYFEVILIKSQPLFTIKKKKYIYRVENNGTNYFHIVLPIVNRRFKLYATERFKLNFQYITWANYSDT